MAGKADSRDNAGAIAPIAWLIVIYWIAQFAILTAQRFLWSEGTEPLIYLVPRGFMSIVGVGISFAIAAWQRRHSELAWGRRLGLALLAALIAAPLHAAINFAAFQIVMPDENMSSTTAASILMGMLNWFWTYAAIAALLLTASYNDALRERERRLSDMQGLAHAAQLRSLRYQLNPHFMFNTLNSVTALIAGGRSDQAEHMVETLADFLRASLAVDPTDDLTLEREFELQSLYLSIESARFCDRLKVETILPDERRQALVPSLILQPIVENAIKHGVARNSGCTTVRVEASRRQDSLELLVTNGLPPDGSKARGGTDVGLANVARRIELRYGGRGSFLAGPAGDSFVVRMSLPIQGCA